MSKNAADNFFNNIDYPSIIDTVKGIYMSDGLINTLLDFERVLDEADLYAFKHWDLGELVDGPNSKRYTVDCMFMYPHKLMPDPRGALRLLSIGCNVKFKKTTIKVPVQVKSEADYKPGTHYPKMVERNIWLIRIEMPKELMNDIREGSIDLAGQNVNLEDLDSAYSEDLDKESIEGDQGAPQQDQAMAPDMGGMGGEQPPLGGM